jgi:hypothetical protein
MSDGPHKSLPLRSYWKNFAERAAKGAYSIEEASEALHVALKKDLREAPLAIVRGILIGDEQESLFGDENLERLEILRQTSPGSSMANMVIDCAIEAIYQGLTGDNAYRCALENAVMNVHTALVAVLRSIIYGKRIFTKYSLFGIG